METPFPALPSGKFVTLHSLKARAELNSRAGIVIRTADDSNPPRHTVYLPAHNLHDSTVVRVKATNLTAVETPTLPRPNRASFSIKLNKFLFSNPRAPSLFYPFGNTSPIYVLPGVPRNATASILLLAAGDLRSALYSIARDVPPRSSPRLSFFVNDHESATIARNIALLWIIRRTNASPQTIFAIWFSLRLSWIAYSALVDAVLALTGSKADEELQAINVSFHTERDRCLVIGVLSSWLKWQDKLKWSTVSRMREKKLIENPTGVESISELAEAMTRVVKLRYHEMNSGQIDFPVDAAMRETSDYFKTGVIQFDEQLEYANPTLFLRPDEYDLHYGSDPFSAFAKFDGVSNTDRPLLTMSIGQMEDWVRATRTHGSAVQWKFSTEDCMSLATSLGEAFDVVSTSNVSDAVGLLPLLQATRGLVKQDGYLLTQTLRFAQYSKNVDDYLLKNLIIAPEYHFSILGWRCVGHEGSLKPPNGNVVVDPPSAPELMLTMSIKNSTGVANRCELNFMWRPEWENNVPLCLSGSDIVDLLVQKFKLRMKTELWGTTITRDTESYSQANMFTLLPLFLSGLGTDEVLREDYDATVELLDVVRFLREESTEEMVKVSIRFAEEKAERCFMGFIPQIEPFVVVDGSGRMLLYIGLFSTFETDLNKWRLTWIMRKDRLTANSVITLRAAISIIDTFTIDQLEIEPVRRSDFSPLIHHNKRTLAAGLISGRSEDSSTWSIPVTISEQWWQAISQKKTIMAKVSNGGNELQVGVGSAFKHCMRFSLPGPASPTGLRVQLSRKRRLVTCLVNKGKYDLQSLFPTSIFLDDTKGMVCSPALNKEFLISRSGMQFSTEEKEISRSTKSDYSPPLIALKDTLLFFFQIQDELYMTLAKGNMKGTKVVPSVQALVVHHGIRIDHRTGLPAADLSICFLEYSFVQEVANWFISKTSKRPQQEKTGRHINCTAEELDLFKVFVKTFSSQLKDADSWNRRPYRAHIEEANIRKRFTRILISPLTSPSVLDSLFKTVS